MIKKCVDIMVLGGTGFTGKFVVMTLANLSRNFDASIRWGISGRSKDKIQDLLIDLEKTGLHTKNITVVECDIKNEESIKNATEISKVVINCTGPNTLLSEPVVRACIKAGTHYIDISAELFHILNLYRNYNKEAEESGVLVIPTCGFCALIVTTGLNYLDKHFTGTLNSVECYGELDIPKRAYFPGRTLIHYGTWESLVQVLNDFKKYQDLKRLIFPTPIYSESEEVKRSFFHRHNGKFWFPYPGTENDVTEISQRYLYDRRQKKPYHFKAYTTVPIFLHYIIIPVFFFYYYMCYFRCFRYLLKTFPRFFTVGYMSHKGPSESIRNQTKFSFSLHGKGFSGSEESSEKSLTVKVSCTDPGYRTTAVSAVCSAITVLKERNQMPKGGVIMPGAAFFDTTIVERLQNNGITYELIENDEFNGVCNTANLVAATNNQEA